MTARCTELMLAYFSRFRDLITWKPVEEVKWRAVPKLGSEWMCKWTIDEKGYWLVLTDGSALWGEMRTATFILEKAEVRP